MFSWKHIIQHLPGTSKPNRVKQSLFFLRLKNREVLRRVRILRIIKILTPSFAALRADLCTCPAFIMHNIFFEHKLVAGGANQHWLNLSVRIKIPTLRSKNIDTPPAWLTAFSYVFIFQPQCKGGPPEPCSLPEIEAKFVFKVAFTASDDRL